jgi:hypothetical protein
MPQSTLKPLGVFTVRENPKKEKGDRAFWVRIGTAFPHQDGTGFNVRLDALPMDGKLVILPPKDDASKDAGESPSNS